LNHRVSRADDFGYGIITDVKIPGGGSDGFMTENLLKDISPGSLFQKVRCKAVPQGMDAPSS